MPQELNVKSVAVIRSDGTAKTNYELTVTTEGSQCASAKSSDGNPTAIGEFVIPAAKEETEYTFELKSTTDGKILGQVDLSRKTLLEQARSQKKLMTSGILVGGKRALLTLPCGESTRLAIDLEPGASLALEQTTIDTDVVHLNIFLSAVGILETRGESTDSFARVTMVAENQSDYEIGRTEICNDDLSPEYRKYIRLSYGQAAVASDTVIRIEVCDPVAAAMETLNNFTVIGAAQLKLTDIHNQVMNGVGKEGDHPYNLLQDFDQGLVIAKLSPKGSGLMSMELRQLGVLQDIVAGRPPKEIQTKRAASLITRRRAEFGDDTAEIEKAEKKQKKAKKNPDELTPKENADLMLASFSMGTLLVAFESVQVVKESTCLTFSTSQLRLNNCSFAPDPYLRIFKKLPTGKDKQNLPGGSWAPYRCPVFKTKPQFATRSPSWGKGIKPSEQICIPNELLTNTDGTPAELIVEAWDFQKRGKDRLIGRSIVDMGKVREGKTTTKLEPTVLADKQDFLDIFYMTIGFGIAKNAGSVTIEVSDKEAAAPPVHHSFTRFDVDKKLREVSGAAASEPAQIWQSLSTRRTQFKAEMSAGEEVVEKGVLLDIYRFYRDTTNVLSVTVGQAFWRLVAKYAWLYKTQMTIGSVHGSATKALFVFMGSIVVQNFILLCFWAPTWVPQIIYTGVDTNPLAEFFSVFSAKEDTRIDTDGASLGVNDSLVEQPTIPKGVLFFSGYAPAAATGAIGADGVEATYPIGVWYLLCAIFSLLVTVIIYTVRLVQTIRYPKMAVSSTSALPAGTASVLNAMFGGWDFTRYGKTTTAKIRKEIVTKIKEGEAEAEREAEKNVVIMTRAQRNVLLAQRIFLFSFATFLSIAGVVIIVFFLTETPFRRIVLKYLEDNVPVIGPLIPALVITIVNGAIPVVVELLIPYEKWSPSVTLRQTLIRIFFVKIVNGITIFINLGVVAEQSKTLSERSCVEKDAAMTILQLLITDFLAAGGSFIVPKWATLTALPWLKYKLLGKKEKIDPLVPVQAPDSLDETSAAAMPLDDKEPPPPSPSPSPPSPASAPAQEEPASAVPEQPEASVEEAAGAPSAPPSPPATPASPTKNDAPPPDGPLLGYLNPKAPPLKLPKEVMEIVYRQLLLFIGMTISPWLFGVGFVFNLVLYIIKFYGVMWYHRRPKEIKEHFAAGSAVRDFYIFMLITTIISWIFFFVYAYLPSNPICGPLRSPECAAGFEANNLTACLVDLSDNRRNYDVLVEYLLPPEGTSLSVSDWDADATVSEGQECGVACVFQNIFQLVVTVPVLLMVMMALIMLLAFSNARAARTSSELKEARRELSIEYQDKKLALRYANVQLS